MVDDELNLDNLINNMYENDTLVNSVIDTLRNNKKIAPTKFKNKL